VAFWGGVTHGVHVPGFARPQRRGVSQQCGRDVQTMDYPLAGTADESDAASPTEGGSYCYIAIWSIDWNLLIGFRMILGSTVSPVKGLKVKSAAVECFYASANSIFCRSCCISEHVEFRLLESLSYLR